MQPVPKDKQCLDENLNPLFTFVCRYVNCFISFFGIVSSGAGSQSGKNKDEEYNEKRKKNNTNYNKGNV